MDDRFLLLIQTALDSKGIKSDYNKLKQMFDKDPAKINAVMDMSATKTQINKFIKEYAPQLQKMFTKAGVKGIDVKDIEASMKSVFVASEKAVKSLANAEKQAYEMNKTFDKQRLADKNKIHLDEIQAYKDNENFNKKAIADKKSLFLAEEQGYKANNSLRQKEIAEQKKLYLDKQQAYKTNDSVDSKLASERNKLSLATLQAHQANNKFNNSMSITKTRADSANVGFTTYLKTLKASALPKYADEIKKISSAFTDVSKTGDKVQFAKANAQLTKFKTNMKDAGNESKSFASILSGDIAKFAQWTISATILMSAINGVKQVITTVSDMDKKITDLRMVIGGSTEDTQLLVNSYNDLAKTLGSTTAEVVTSANEWLRMGKSIEETNTLITNSMILSKLAQLSSADATKYLTSTMLGYKIAAEDTLTVVDMLSSVDMISATSAGGLAEAMSKTSASAELAGVDIEKLIGMLAVVGEVSQKSMDTVGESFKTIFARMGNVKLGKLIDEDGEDITTQINDVEKILDKVNLTLRDSATEFRDFDDVLDDVGSNWKSFNEVEQSAIATTFAGVRQRENFVILMENYGNSLKYAETAANSAGTAMEKFSYFEESAEAKTNRLKSSLDSLSMNTLNSGVIKGFLDFSNVLITVVDKLGLFNIALVVTAGVLGGKGILPLIPLVSKAMVSLGTSMGLTGAGAGVLVASLSAMLPIIAGLLAIAGVVALYDHLNVSMKEHRENIEKLATAYDLIKTELQGLQDELIITGEKIDILNAKDNLTILEDGELEDLKELNKELGNRVTLLKDEASIKAGDLNKEIVSTFKSDFKNNDEYATYDYNPETNAEEYNRKDEFAYFNEQVKLAEELIALGDKRTEQQDDQLESIKTYTTAVGRRIDEDTKSFVVFDDETKKQKQVWEELIDLSAKVADPARWKQLKFDEIFNSDTFAKTRYELEEMAKAGGLKPSDLYRSAEYQKLLTDTGLSASEAAQHINSLALATDKATDSFVDEKDVLEDLANALTAMSDSDKALTDIKAEVKEFGAISMDTINSLMGKYPQLTDVLYDYLNGLSSTKDVVNALSGVYSTDLENWKVLLVSKYENNEEFLNQVGGNNSKLINAMMDQYGIDLSNNRSYLESKMDILNTYLGTAGGAWLKYYDIASGKTKNLGDLSAGDQYYISKQSTLANQALATFNEGLDFSKIESNFKTSNGEFKTDKGDSKADKADKAAADKEKKRQEAIQKVKDAFAKENNADKFELDMGKINEAEYYKRLKNLNKEYFKGKLDFLDEDRQNQVAYYKWSEQRDKEYEDKKTKTLENIADKYKELYSDIVDELENEKSDVLDNIDEAHESIIDSLEKEKDNYKDIVETQLELLDAKKKQDDYEKSITKRTSEISKIEQRKIELEKAAKSGDRSAIAELSKLNEDLADKKEELTDEQNDHELDLQKESLQNALDLNGKLMDAKISSENSRFEAQKSNIERLYDMEIELINKATQYKAKAFKDELDKIATELASNGVIQSADYLNNVKNTQAPMANTEIDTSTSNRSAILSILSNGSGKDYGDDASALASYTRDNYGSPISKSQAVEVAKLLGVSGISSVSDLTDNDKNKNKILEALKKAKFHNGGYIDASGLSNKEGLGLVKHGEPVLTVEEGKLFKELVSNFKPLNNLVKLSTPDFSKFTTNNNSNPIININLPASTTIDNSAINNYRKLIPELTNAVSEQLMNTSRQYK